MQKPPRVSVTKLMEFMTALPSRRAEIVDNQKNPSANKPKITWCARARKAIIEFFAGGCSDESILDNEIERLQAMIESLDEKDLKKLESKTNKIQIDIDAINSFKGLHKKIGLKEVLFTRSSSKPKHLDYSGVHLSVRPEILVLTKNWEHIGCLKLYFTKNARLKKDDADFLCAVLHHYADEYLSPHHSANPKACIAIDVFGQRIFTATETVPLHEATIKKHCKIYKELWSKAPTRKPIDGKGDNQDELGFES